jgi:oligoribonuclease NrnB/cAMP/cGMP phosphodiesterase (DHH superfamily)
MRKIKHFSTMRKPILIYHDGCPDGFGAALAFWKKFGDSIEYCPKSHSTKRFFGLKEEYLIGREIYMADIAFIREDIEFLMKNADITVIDHHKSAEKDSGDLECCHFDMKHSGSVLAWKFCHPGVEVPTLFRYIEDRDLWNFKLNYSKEMLAALDSYDKTFEVWDSLMIQFDNPGEFADILKDGSAILRYTETIMKRIINLAYTTEICGYKVPIVNTPFFSSEIISKLAVNNPFSAGYHFDGENFIFSLRADGNNTESIDVSEIAANFPGGGGHKYASGFSIKDLNDLNRKGVA